MYKYIYIQKDLNGLFGVDVELSSADKQIGENWSDYLKGEWLKLNDKQIAFANNHIDCTHNEIWLCKKLSIRNNPISVETKVPKQTLRQKVAMKVKGLSISKWFVEFVNRKLA